MKEAFFSNFSNDSLNYLNGQYIPTRLDWLDVPGENRQVPIIYGENKLVFDDDYVFCGADIFASAFFMLTRWEEICLPKDKLGRCDENEMFVVKHNVYNRSIVNEYIELLSKILQCLGVKVKGSDRKFTPFITHDIDYLFRYASIKNFCENLVGDIVHRKNLKIFLLTCKNYIRYQLGQIKDPFDTFDEIMDLSDTYGFKDAFYFKAAIFGEDDSTYDICDKRVGKIIHNILARGHEIGFHPSVNTFHNPKQFEIELNRLKSVCPNIDGGRQHFLLYELPFSLQIWNQNGLKYDTGLGFASRAGFRCGICWEYPFFDVLQRAQLKIQIRPLIVMEGAVLKGDWNLEKATQEIYSLIDVVYKHKGEFVFLWHNDHFYRHECLSQIPVYRSVIHYLGNCNKQII
ncbi:MAG: polysaccharide deacetylase family protein [Bacteroidales bacterium]|nr:polysaccharide deacetylase family protein [Bacteroidales bacterium]